MGTLNSRTGLPSTEFLAGLERSQNTVMNWPVRVDSGARIQALAALKITEPPARLFDDDRWCRMIPDVSSKPHTQIQFAFSNSVLMTPCASDRGTTRHLYDRVLMLGVKRRKGGQCDDALWVQRA